MNPDLVIAGGGPAGLSTAIAARRRGLSCVVLERRHPPLDKACGEGLMPGGCAWLEQHGVGLAATERAEFRGIRYQLGPWSAEARFSGRPGFGIRRTILSAALRARAVELGAVLMDETELVAFREFDAGVDVETTGGPLCGRYLVGADGLGSVVRRLSGLELKARGPRRFGIRRHFRVEPWTDLVEVHFGDACEAYVTPVAPDLVGVAILFLRRGKYDDLLAGLPALAARLRQAEVASTNLGAGPFRRRSRARATARVALVGDAAGYRDAITGEGLTLAFHQGELLAETVAEGQPLSRYDARAARSCRDIDLLTALVLRMARGRSRRLRLVKTLARHPDLLERALAVLAGEALVDSLRARDLLRIAPLLV